MLVGDNGEIAVLADGDAEELLSVVVELAQLLAHLRRHIPVPAVLVPRYAIVSRVCHRDAFNLFPVVQCLYLIAEVGVDGSP